MGSFVNGLGRLANKGEAGYIIKVTKSFHSLALKNTVMYLHLKCQGILTINQIKGSQKPKKREFSTQFGSDVMNKT